MGKLHNTYTDSACNYIVHALNTDDKLMDKRHVALNRTLISISIVFVLLALAFTASATDYYVSTGGNDGDAGTSLSVAWQNISYAATQVSAGDTVHIVDGVYHEANEVKIRNVDGNATHPIIFIAYNGTPIINQTVTNDDFGFYIDGSDYVYIDGIDINGFTHEGVFITYSNNMRLLNCTINNSHIPVEVYHYCNNTWIENVTGINTGWNGIMISNYNAPLGVLNNTTLKDCTLRYATNHGGVDIAGNVSYVYIDNLLVDSMQGGLYSHGDAGWINKNITLINSVISNSLSNGVSGAGYENLLVENCTFYNISNRGFHIHSYAGTGLPNSNANITIKNCTVYNVDQEGIRVVGSNIVCENNSVNNVGRVGSGYHYTFDSGTYTRVIDAHEGTIHVISHPQTDTTMKVLWHDGTVFTQYIHSNDYGDWHVTPPEYHSDKSNCSIFNRRVTITTYNVTLRPTRGHLYDVTVDAWDEASGTYRITASSTEPDNPTWINLTTKAASTTYNIKRDDESYDTQASTSADGVLRYRHTGEWNGPQTFEISESTSDATPRITYLRNDAPTQQTVTLFWGCSVSDIDHYTIHKNGVLLDTTESQYYSATNLAPDTTYTFGVSATTTDGITSETVTLSVQTAAEEAEDFGSNTLHIADDVTASPGGSVTVPIMIHNATGVACAGLNLTYDASVVTVTTVTGGGFTSYIDFDAAHVADGQVILNTYINGTQLTGDAKVADVTFVAVGEAGDTSPLDMEIISMTDQDGYPVPGIVSNGLFTVVSDTSPPIATDPSASQLIPDDTDGVPLWGETATLNITVTDESDIASVTIDLSAIGGSPVQPMTHIGGNVWSVTTSASAGTSPQTYGLQVCATDIHGYTNMSESIELVVMKNGDVNGDGDVKLDDAKLLGNCVTHPDRQTLSSEFVADVTGDGVVDIADAMLLANHVVRPDRYTLR